MASGRRSQSRIAHLSDALILAYGGLLPFLMYWAPVSIKGAMGALVIVACSLRWGLRGGLLAGGWASALILSFWALSPDIPSYSLIGGLAVYGVIASGVGRAVDTISRQRDLLIKEIEVRQEIEADRDVRHRQLLALFHNSMSAIIQFDGDSRVVAVNSAFTRIFGYTAQEARGQDVDDLLVPREGMGEANRYRDQLFSGSSVAFEALRRRKDGSTLPCQIRGVPIIIDDKVVGGFAIYLDITEDRKREADLRYLSLHDTLTGLYNRSYFEQEMKRLEGSRHYPITIISIDVDGLKLVNDALGHGRGDDLLKRFATLLESSFRSSDVVARVGGDEFAVILPETDYLTAQSMARRLECRLEEENRDKTRLPLSASVGLSTADGPEHGLEETMIRADSQMYLEKDRRHASDDLGMVGAVLRNYWDMDSQEPTRLARVEAVASCLGRAAGLGPKEKENLSLLIQAANLGMVGFILARQEIDPSEIRLGEHARIGSRIARASRQFQPISHLILHQHESWDGSGYPEGLSGDQIPIESRIFRLAEAFDNLTRGSDGVPALSAEDALAHLAERADREFDPRLVQILEGLFRGTLAPR